MSTLDIIDGQFLHTHTTNNSGDYSVLLNTENKFVDKNIGIKITTPSGTAAADSATIDAILNTTEGSNSGINIHSVLSTPNNNTVEPDDNSYYFAINVSGSGSSQITKKGWFNTGTLPAASTSSTRYFNIAAATISGSSTNATATTTVAPGTVSVAKQSTPEGVTNAASNDATTTVPSSGVYVAVKATAAANTTGATSSISGSGSAIVNNAGYAPKTLTGSITVSGTATAKTSSKSSSTTYIPITIANPIFDGGTLSGNSTATGTNVTLSSTDNGIKIQTAYTASSTAVLYNGAVEGWVSRTDNTQALKAKNIGSTNGTAYYITAVTIPKDKGFSVTTTADTALDTASDLDITNAAYRRIDITNAANGTVLISNNAGNITATQTAKTGTIKINAFNTNNDTNPSGEQTIVENGVWKTTTITTKPSSATTYYGRVYVNLNTTSVTQTNTTISGTTVTRGTASWGTGWINSGSISAATFANTATSGKTYVDISDTSAAPVLTNGVLYINKGYVDDISISLGQLIPDTITDKTYAPAEYIRSGYAAYGADGSIIAGTMPDITPAIIATPSNTTYFTEQSGSSGASFSITPSYTNSTAGYLTQHTTAQNGTAKYYKIISATFTGNGGNVALTTDTSQTNSIYRTGSESYISVEEEAPEANTNFVYVKVTGSGTAKANKAGWITLNGATATGSSIKYIKIAKYAGDYTTA